MMKNLHKALRERAGAEHDESGFTLIELLIVIVVLGVLAAVVIFSLSGVTTSSAVSACNSDAKTVQTAVQAYIANGNAAPATTAAAKTAMLPPASPSYVHTWPSSSGTVPYYTIDIGAATPSVAGEVDVTVPASHGGSGTAVNYDTNNGAVCGTISK